MTQEMINKEKEELMNRIKKRVGSFHTVNVIDLIYTAALSIFFLILLLGGDESTYGFQFFGILLLVFGALAMSFIMWKYSATLKSISDAEEYVQHYDKFRHYSLYWCGIPFAIVFTAAAFLLWGSAIATLVVVGWAILILAIILSGAYKNKDIERLRELLELEDNATPN
ncbi:MAG: hypothetical protein IJK41_08000 [Muribaculaceae bacterium]|nr:hypothetical protein [Muribaculaceae bacterium]